MVQVRVYPDRAAVAAAVRTRLLEVVRQAMTDRGVAHVVLTGGSMGEALMTALARQPRRQTAQNGTTPATPVEDWSGVHLWWGDERYLPAADPDRNDTQADHAGLTRLYDAGLRPEHVHRLPGPDDPRLGDDLAAAAREYAEQLRAQAPGGGLLPEFDVVMLGVGPDGHVASLFPAHPSTRHPDPADSPQIEATMVAVEGSPKPPPRRLSMTLPTLCSARDVWLMAAGSDKAAALRQAQTVSDPHVCPAGAVHGQAATVWWLDEAAAHQLSS